MLPRHALYRSHLPDLTCPWTCDDDTFCCILNPLLGSKHHLQAIKGQDPFQQQATAAAVEPSGARGASHLKERKQRQPKVDPEFVAFGLLLKDSLVYLYMALFILCQASSFVLIKVRRGVE